MTLWRLSLPRKRQPMFGGKWVPAPGLLAAGTSFAGMATTCISALLFVCGAWQKAAAQSAGHTAPSHFPLNPMAVSRSGLYSQPYVPVASGWRHSLSFDYGSSVEWENSITGATYVLDAELMRAHLQLRKDLSPRRFFQVALDVNGVFNGFADAAFDWYHSTMGIGFRGRENRPQNEFRYSLSLPTGISVERERPDYYIGDLLLGYGLRHGSRNQTTLALSIPTSTAPDGYAKKTFFVGAIHTFRTDLSRQFSFEATLGAGYTPATGDLSPIQNELFNSASTTIQFHLSSRNTFYGSLFTHSALYKSTFLPELENRELTGNFGWQGRTASGREWRIGVTEDFGPADAGLDLILRFGVNW